MKIYLVGGAVRDGLLGLPVEEQDWVVVGSTPEEMTRLGYRPVGKDFPVFLHPKTNAEYALARTERKTAKGYKGFQVYAAPEVTLEEDLQRRDLTINAIAQTEEGEIIDPYGGQKDLQARILRHVSPAFVEDPVRILRIARFAARFPDFQIHPDTLRLMQIMVEQGEVDALVPERVWQEWHKSLQTENPARFLEVLIKVGAFAVLFPAWETYEAGLIAMSGSELPIIRLAVLFYATPLEVIARLHHRYRVPKDYEEFTRLICTGYPKYKDLNTADATCILSLLEHIDVFRRPKRLELFLLACQVIDNNTGSSKVTFLYSAYMAAKSVAVQSLIEPGMKGEEIKKAVRKQREKAIAQTGILKI